MTKVEAAQAIWAPPIELSLKKDEALNFCFNYKNLHVIIGDDYYQLPGMDDDTYSFAGDQILLTLDAGSG